MTVPAVGSEKPNTSTLWWSVAVALVLCGLVGAGLTVVAATTGRGGPGITAKVSVPVLSARRAPQALQLAVGRSHLSNVVTDQLASSDLGPAREKSCVVVSAAGGLVVAESPDLLVVPASTMKVLTATSALARLGGPTRFRTEVRSVNKPSGPTLNGDLWLVGGGDPLLETADYTKTQRHDPAEATSFDALVDDMVKTGITTVTGSVVGDGRRFDDKTRVSSWKRSYTSGGEVGVISGLMVNDNSSVITAKGRRVASTDPSADAARLLKSMLGDRGITVLGESRSAVGTDRAAGLAAPETLAVVESGPIGDVVGEMLRWSDNTTAEMLVKEIGYVDGSTPVPGGWPLGLTRIERSLHLSGVTGVGLRLIDGSGLDVSNRVTCRILLQTIESHPKSSAFFAGLPVMGESGTLRSRLRNSPAKGRVRAKTGTLNGVSSLAGVADASDGSVITFAMVFNGLSSTATGVAAADAIVEALVEFPRAPSLAEFHRGLPLP